MWFGYLCFDLFAGCLLWWFAGFRLLLVGGLFTFVVCWLCGFGVYCVGLDVVLRWLLFCCVIRFAFVDCCFVMLYCCVCGLRFVVAYD